MTALEKIQTLLAEARSNKAFSLCYSEKELITFLESLEEDVRSLEAKSCPFGSLCRKSAQVYNMEVKDGQEREI